jgi:hypothetical protein
VAWYSRFLSVAGYLAVFFSISGGYAAVVEQNYHLNEDFSVGELCKSAPFGVLSPGGEAPFKESRSEDDAACQLSFALDVEGDDDYMAFGVFFVKEKLEEKHRSPYSKFIINAFVPAENKYIRLQSEDFSDGYYNQSYIVGLNGEDSTREARFQASYIDRSGGTIVIYAMAPSVFWTGEKVKNADGELVELPSEFTALRKYMEGWNAKIKPILRDQNPN